MGKNEVGRDLICSQAIQQYLGSSQMIFDIQSPLPDMRTISGHDSRRGYFINPRSSFYGDESYVHLLGLLFL